MLLILVILFVLAVGRGSLSYSQLGYEGLSPAGVILLILLLLWLTGCLF
jgi:hypothetical protein